MSDQPTPTPNGETSTALDAGLANDAALIARNLIAPGIVDLDLQTTPIKTLGIIGCGLMGCSIAHLAIIAGMRVVMVDASETALATAAAMFVEQVDSGAFDISASYQRLADADLVIEAVVETLPVKKQVHEKIEAVVSPNTIVATNTSSIPLASMESHFQHPGRFCGIHFCHPEVMALVEVISSVSTEPQTIASAVGFVRQLEKMPIAIKDSAGFVVNRLLAAMLNQALRLLSSGIPVARVDQAMRQFGFDAGPFEIIDIIGADTCMYAGRTMWEHKMKCVSLSPILPRLVKHGRLGRKAGAGFYAYPDPADRTAEAAVDDPELMPLIQSYCKDAADEDIATVDDNTQMATEILAPVVLEATRLIDEGIVADFRDIDLAFTHGLSFPQAQGGLLFWADRVGLKKLMQVLTKLAESDPRLAPSDMIESMAADGRKFYSSSQA